MYNTQSYSQLPTAILLASSFLAESMDLMVVYIEGLLALKLLRNGHCQRLTPEITH